MLVDAPNGWAPWTDHRPGFSDYTRGADETTAWFRRSETAVSMYNPLSLWSGRGWVWQQADVSYGGDWPASNAVAGKSGIKFPLPGLSYIKNGTGYGGRPGSPSRPGASIRWRWRVLGSKPILGLYIYSDDAPLPYGRRITWMTQVSAKRIRSVQLGVNWDKGLVRVFYKTRLSPWWRKGLVLSGLVFPPVRPYVWWHGWRRALWRGGRWAGDGWVRLSGYRVAKSRKRLKG